MKKYNLFWSIESIINFQRQDSLPTHIYSLGQPISDNGAVLCVKIWLGIRGTQVKSSIQDIVDEVAPIKKFPLWGWGPIHLNVTSLD